MDCITPFIFKKLYFLHKKSRNADTENQGYG